MHMLVITVSLHSDLGAKVHEGIALRPGETLLIDVPSGEYRIEPDIDLMLENARLRGKLECYEAEEVD